MKFSRVPCPVPLLRSQYTSQSSLLKCQSCMYIFQGCTNVGSKFARGTNILGSSAWNLCHCTVLAFPRFLKIFFHPVILCLAIRKRKANWNGHILRRNCLLKQVIEGNINGEREVTRRQGRRRKKLLDDLKDRRGHCHLTEEALDRNIWRDCFGRGFKTVVRQITE